MAEAVFLDFWEIGDWKVDPSDDTISRNGEATKLEPRTMRLLVCLVEAQGVVVGLDELLNDVWAGVVVGPASVYQSVAQLRKLLQDTNSPPAYIETVARKGYRLVAPARRVAPPKCRRCPRPDADGCAGWRRAQRWQWSSQSGCRHTSFWRQHRKLHRWWYCRLST